MADMSSEILLADTEFNRAQARWWNGQARSFPGAVPLGEVEKALDWTPYEATVDALVETPQGFVRVSDEDHKMVVHPRTLEPLGVVGSRRPQHPYKEWLLDKVALMLDEQLRIASGGWMRGGRVAWVQVETSQVEGFRGVTYRPYVVAHTSYDASLATTYKAGTILVVCENTFSAMVGEASENVYRVKHTAGSEFNVLDAREAMGWMATAGAEFEAQVAELMAAPVSDQRFRAFAQAWAVPPKEASMRSWKAGTRRADELVALWEESPMVAPWAGTEFGVLQAVSTWAHHVQGVRGRNRGLRNLERTVTKPGEWGKVTDRAREILATV